MPSLQRRLEQGAAGFRYLNQSSNSAAPCYTLKDVDDGEGLRSTLDAMSIVGISEAEREAVLRTVAAVLHLGNITFVSAPDEGPGCCCRPLAGSLSHPLSGIAMIIRLLIDSPTYFQAIERPLYTERCGELAS